jgi:hypothetical protein
MGLFERWRERERHGISNPDFCYSGVLKSYKSFKITRQISYFITLLCYKPEGRFSIPYKVTECMKFT